MEILLTIMLTLMFVLFLGALYFLFLVKQELHTTQVMMQQMADFVNQMGAAIQDAKEIIEFKKQKLGLRRHDEESDM